jgi:hypothetical protein
VRSPPSRVYVVKVIRETRNGAHTKVKLLIAPSQAFDFRFFISFSRTCVGVSVSGWVERWLVRKKKTSETGTERRKTKSQQLTNFRNVLGVRALPGIQLDHKRQEEHRKTNQLKGETQRELTYFGNVLGVRALPGIQLDHKRQEKNRKT